MVFTISIHSPYTGRDRGSGSKEKSGSDFNPLSLYRERPSFMTPWKYSKIFQSTLPIQGETKCSALCSLHDDISIHSPYTGRDSLRKLRSLLRSYFNPLSLYRERQLVLPKIETNGEYFNPLSLYRERRRKHTVWLQIMRISIHSPYTGRDSYIRR